MSISIIARLTFREALRRKIALAALALGAAFLILFGVGFYLLQRDAMPSVQGAAANVIRNQIYNFLTMAGLYAVNFLTLAMGALLAADTLAGEISSGTIQAIVTKPIRRAEIVLGKWLGFAILLALYLTLMAGGVLGLVFILSGYHAQNIVTGVALIYLESLLIMTVTLVCSSRLSALATGGVIFGLYGVAFIGGWVEQAGVFFENQTAIYVGIITSLIIPSEALWRRASFDMTSPLLQATRYAAGPFTTASVPSPLMVVYALLYLVVALWLAVRQFSARDL